MVCQAFVINYKQVLLRISIMNSLKEFNLYFKNHLAKTLIACWAFMANYKQVLSKILIINSLEELYLYFKNHFARTLIVYWAFITNYKQALLKTLIMNSLEDLYLYFKSLNILFIRIYNIFKVNYGNKLNLNIQDCLLTQLFIFMLCQTHKDLLFKCFILKISKTQAIIYQVKFNDIKCNTYNIIKNKFIGIINGFAQLKKLKQKYKHIFT